MKLVITIISGGSGARLWPISREDRPKPFIRLEDGLSLLQKAFLRGMYQPFIEEVITVTNQSLLYPTLDDYREVNSKNVKSSFILESTGRNTAPAIFAAACRVNDLYDADTLMLVLPADHLVKDLNAFNEAIKQAIKLALEDKLVTFGIRPDRPETSYGYIKAEGFKVLGFFEKPSKEKAINYISEGNFYWNSGMFCFKASTLIGEMKLHAPEIASSTLECLKHSNEKMVLGHQCIFLDKERFKSVPSDSIDYALLEKSSSVAVVPCSIGWSDIGSWLALTDLTKEDAQSNRIHGEAILYSTRNSSVHSTHRMVAIVGVDNLIVAETADAVLVIEKSHVQEVKMVFNQLKKIKHSSHQAHRETFRPWGSYTVLHEDSFFKVKSIKVNPLQKLSLQRHQHRAEHWVVVKGRAHILNNGEQIILEENQSTYIAIAHKHQLMNPTSEILEIIEVQSGSYVGEDDIERFEDTYDRDISL